MFKKKNSLNNAPTKAQALAAIPVINSDVRAETLESGEVLITYPVRLRPFLVKLTGFWSKPPHITYRKLQLDQLGSSVWKLLDGQRPVRQIINKFAQTHQLHPKEAELSVTQFLRTLGRRGLIGLR